MTKFFPQFFALMKLSPVSTLRLVYEDLIFKVKLTDRMEQYNK